MINEQMLNLGKERSAIRELFEQGKILKEKYGVNNVYDFSLGNPSVQPPCEVTDTIKNLFKVANIIDLYGKDNIDINIESFNQDYQYRKLNTSDLHSYTSAQGDIDVRLAIQNYINKTYNVNIDANLMYMTVGAACGLSISLRAIISNPNDEVIVFAPYFPEYKVFIENANAKCICVEPDCKTFYPNIVDFKNKISKNTVAIIINTPNNPTGVVYDEEIIKTISDILIKKENEYGHPIYIVSDEPYRELIYNKNKKHCFITNYYSNSIVNYSFSKVVSLPGERIGYIVVNPNCTDAQNLYYAICGSGRSEGYVCANSLFQYTIPHILGATADLTIYKHNAEFLYNELTRIGYNVIYPDGAFYLFAKALCDDDNEFSKKALDYNILVVPSTSFGVKGYFRIAYCVHTKMIINSIQKFKELYDFYNKGE